MIQFLSVAVTVLLMSTSFAARFSPKEILGVYHSQDKKAEVTVYQTPNAESENPSYTFKMNLDPGPCMGLYGTERKLNIKSQEVQLGGSLGNESLTVKSGEESNSDGDVYVDNVTFTAKKSSSKGKSGQLSFELKFSLTHNPDLNDGDDGGVADFDQCYDKTKRKWVLTKVK